MTIQSLKLRNFGPFDDIEFKFDENITVFVGPNNSGKTTVLVALAEISVFPFRTPTRFLRNDPAKFNMKTSWGSHSQGTTHSGTIPILWKTTAQEKLGIKRLKELGCTIFIPAIRRSTDYRSEGPTTGKTPTRRGKSRQHFTISEEDYGVPSDEFMADVEREHNPELKKRLKLFKPDSSYVSDEAIIQKIIDLDYKSYREAKKSVRHVIEKVATVASEITEGFPIKFVGVGEDEVGLYPNFATPDGEMPLNLLSQGTQSIIHFVSYLLIGYAEYYNYAKNYLKNPAILIIDEIDAHLHPSWQRRILPTLTRHFPRLQIFCSTHSPLMLAGLKTGQIQLLQRDKKGNATVSTNETDIVSWSGDEILRNIFELTNVTDLATDEKLQRLMTLRRKKKLTNKETRELNRLRRTINENLLSSPISHDIEQLVDSLKKTIDMPSAKKESKTLTSRANKPRSARRKSVS